MSESENGKQRRSGIILSYVYSVAQIVVGLLYVPLLLNGIGQSEYGLYQFVGSIMSYLISINSVLAAGVGRFYCKYQAENNTIMMENTLAIAKRIYWGASAIILLASIAAGALVSMVYVNSFTEEQLHECFILFIILGINCVVTTNNLINVAAITANERFVFLKSSQLITVVAQPILVILLVDIYPKAVLIAGVVLFTNLICAVLQRIYAKDVLQIRYTYHGFDRVLFKNLVTFSGAILMVAVADQIFWRMDQIIIGYFYGTEQVAIYAVGSQIIMSFLPFGTAISSVFLPKLSDIFHAKKDLNEISLLFIKVGRITFYLVFGILCAFVIFGKSFVILWAGDEYVIAYYIAVIVMIPTAIDLTQNLGLTILQVENKYYFRGYVRLSIAILNAIVTFYVVQHFGIISAAAVTAIASFLGDGIIMNWYYAKKIKLDIKAFWVNILKIAIPIITLSIPCYIAVNCFDDLFQSWSVIVPAMMLYVILYILVSYRVSMNNSEKDIIMAVVKRIKAVK